MQQEQENQQEQIDIKSRNQAELAAEFQARGLPGFRAKQVFSWLHEKRVLSFEEMSNLPAALRKTLGEKYYINSLLVAKRLVSKLDGTIKYLFTLRDNNCVEAVLMRYRYGNSLCISTQVGCRMGCKFCASTLGGLVRNLTPAEMLDEVYAATTDSGARVSKIVLMGIGEPLDNYDNVLQFLKMISAPEGYGLSLRNLSLSTCGLVPQIDQLAEEKLGLTLSISLHAPNNQIRSKTMPVNQSWDIGRLLAACQNYFEKTGRRISFEYALIQGINDELDHAEELAQCLRGMNCHVNLIPVNPVKERGYRRGSRERIDAFAALLDSKGITATVRRELGTDINAACGQLRREQTQAEEENRC